MKALLTTAAVLLTLLSPAKAETCSMTVEALKTQAALLPDVGMKQFKGPEFIAIVEEFSAVSNIADVVEGTDSILIIATSDRQSALVSLAAGECVKISAVFPRAVVGELLASALGKLKDATNVPKL